MTNSVVYRELEINDIPDMVSLIDSIYAIKKNEDYFRWHCFENVVPVKMIGCYVNGQFVGMFGIHKRRLTNGLVCGQAKSMNIGDNWRKKGYFAGLGTNAFAAFEDLDVICVFANKNATISCENSLDMKQIGTIKTRVFKEINLVSYPDGVKCSAIDSYSTFKNETCFDKQKVNFEISQEYRSWRYAQNPLYDYYKTETKSGSYSIIKLFKEPHSKKAFGDIVDIVCIHDSDAERMDLITGSCWYLRQLGADEITTWAMPGSKLSRALDELNFKQGSVASYFNVKVVNPEVSFLYNFDRWIVRQSDAENY